MNRLEERLKRLGGKFDGESSVKDTDVGNFLAVECENPTKEIIEDVLGFENPEYITVPFSDLV